MVQTELVIENGCIYLVCARCGDVILQGYTLEEITKNVVAAMEWTNDVHTIEVCDEYIFRFRPEPEENPWGEQDSFPEEPW